METPPSPPAGPPRQPDERRDALELAAASVLVGLAAWAIDRALFHFGHFSWRLAPDLLMQALFVLALSAFFASRARILLVQLVLDVFLFSLNSIKVQLMQIPVIPTDYLLLREGAHIIGADPRQKFFWIIGAGLIAATACIAFMVGSFRRPGVKRLARAVPAALFCAVVAFLYGPYCDAVDRFVTIPWPAQTEREESFGVYFSFSIELARLFSNTNGIASLKEVARAEARLLSGQPRAADRPGRRAAPPKRNIYFFLTESFWDPVPPGADQPSPSLLAPEFNALWSSAGRQHMLSPTFGGGTADVEFEALCGMPSAIVFEGIVFQNALRRPLPCLPRILAQNGYRTFAFHSNSGGFYNRDVAYHLLGFDRFYDREALDSSEKIAGQFISDRSLIEQAVRTARRQAAGRPFLAYVMTIAGHWPYRWDDKLYPRTLDVSWPGDETRRQEAERHFNINYYTSGLLADWARRIRKEDPDAIVVITGDHQPGLAFQSPVPDEAPLRASGAMGPRYFKTPLLVLDRGRAKPARPEESAYEVPDDILDRLGLPDQARYHMPLFRRSGRGGVRPTVNGTILLNRGEDFKDCTPPASDPACYWTWGWLRDADVVATDLTLGPQHLLNP
ncbi:MAG: LTA synthase family protein [Elusimicrobia bacterium]|nr:LTA synthase family protein [Elusimicrobiota bacterium]